MKYYFSQSSGKTEAEIASELKRNIELSIDKKTETLMWLTQKGMTNQNYLQCDTITTTFIRIRFVL